MSNGYGPAIRVFTKISSVPVGHLKSLGHNSVVYVDDSYLQREHTKLVLIIFETPLNY